MSSSFADLGVPTQITRALQARGITEPFPIQGAALPDALAGRDVCGRAPTGSGKTLAFGIPLAAQVTSGQPKRPTALVLVPTRELAGQVRDELTALLEPMGRSVHAFYGGVGFGAQLTALRGGVDVVVACPGRLTDLVNRGEVRLDRVSFVVVDEADRMADMGFLPEVRRLLDRVADDRQTLLFSATLDGEVDTLIRSYQTEPARHGVEAGEDAPVNHHVLWQVERDERVGVAAELVSAHWPAIVFSRTKHGADRLARQLTKQGVAATAIHGNRSQSQRERALASFGAGQSQALVATDVAARGIHVDDVACVVHYDAPPDPKDFVHRSGRTGRAGAEGLVVTLAPEADAKVVTRMMAKAGVQTRAVAPDVASLGVPTTQRTTPAGRNEADRANRPARRSDGPRRRSDPQQHNGASRRGHGSKPKRPTGSKNGTRAKSGNAKRGNNAKSGQSSHKANNRERDRDGPSGRQGKSAASGGRSGRSGSGGRGGPNQPSGRGTSGRSGRRR